MVACAPRATGGGGGRGGTLRGWPQREAVSMFEDAPATAAEAREEADAGLGLVAFVRRMWHRLEAELAWGTVRGGRGGRVCECVCVGGGGWGGLLRTRVACPQGALMESDIPAQTLPNLLNVPAHLEQARAAPVCVCVCVCMCVCVCASLRTRRSARVSPQFLLLGVLTCADVFLHNITLFPLRCVRSLWWAVTGARGRQRASGRGAGREW